MPKIIKTMKNLGYSPNEGGVCYGVAMMASQAIIRNQSHHFINRIKFIKNTPEEQIKSLVEPFDRKVQKELHDIKIDLCCFFDELAIYQGNKSVNKDFKSIVPDTQHADNVKNLAGGEKNSPYIYPEIKENIINLFTYYDFFDFLMKMKQHLGDRSFSIVISHAQKNHATQIGFDAKQKTWLSSDHDYFITGNNHLADILKVIDNIFIPHKYRYDGVYKLALSMDIILSEKSEIEEDVDLSIFKYNDFNLDQIRASFNREALSHLIGCYEHASRYDEMMTVFDRIKVLNLPEEENIKLLESKRNNGLTIFHFLAGKGKYDELRAILEKTEEMQLSLSSKIGILDKRKDIASILPFSLKYGYEKVVNVLKVLIDTIKVIEDEDAKVRLLGAKNSDGLSILLLLAANGHLEVIETFINATYGLKDSQKAELLEARDDEEGMTALLAAAENGHTKVVEALITAIYSLEDQQLIAKLLEAKDNYGISALSIAAENGHTKVVEALVVAICNIKDQQMRAKLLESKRKNGESVLFLAAKKGQKEIVKVLMDAIDTID